MNESEKELLDRIAKGDEEAFAQFAEDRRPGLIIYVERNLGLSLRRKVDPEDICQEAIVDCVRALSDVDLNGRDPFGWMCQMAQRRIIDAHRRFFGSQKRSAGREVALEGDGGNSQNAGLINMIVASITSPSAAFSRHRKESNLGEAICQFPAETQAVLRMRYVEGRPTKEIATELGKSDAAIRVLLTRTVKKLQEMLGEQDI